jgi:uncharacterized membrane protein YbhN (UPF0104 family)
MAIERQHVMQLLRLVGAPLLLAAVVWMAGPQAVLAAVRDADVGWLLLGLLSATAGNTSSSLRWSELARWLGHRVRARWAIAVYFRGVAINALLPGAVLGGDMFRAWQLHRDGCPMGAASLSVVLDRLSGLWILFALGALALFAGTGTAEMEILRTRLHIPEAWSTAVIAAALLGTVLLLPLLVLSTLAGVAGYGARAGGRRATAVELLRRPNSFEQYQRQAAASLVVQAFAVGALYCAGRAFGVVLPWWVVAFTAGPIFLFAALPVSFGGWGTREVATVTAWSAFGIAPPLAVAAAAAFGVYALAQSVLAWLPMPATTPASAPTPELP